MTSSLRAPRAGNATTVAAWAGLALGVGGFAVGALGNPAALEWLWRPPTATWIAVLVALAALVAVIQRRSPRPARVAAGLGAAAVLAAFGVAAFATVALMLAAAFAFGAWIVAPARAVADDEFAAHAVLAIAAGLAAFALLLGFAAHQPVNTVPGYLALFALALWVGRRHVAQAWRMAAARSRAMPADDARTPAWLLALLWLGFALQGYFAALPERYHDALSMHLLVARALELYGRWHFDVREFILAVQPMGANWLFSAAWVMGGEPAAKLLNLVLLLLIAATIATARLLPPRAGLAAVAAFLLLPLTFIETASLFVENALTLFVVTAIVQAVRLRDDPAAVAGFAVAAGAAVAVKLHGVLAVGVVAVALVPFGGWGALRAPGRRGAVALAAAALGALWPYVIAWSRTRNPVFPYFNGLFKSPLYPSENFLPSIYARGVHPGDWYDLAFSASKYLEGNDGAAGFVLTLLLPAGLAIVALRGSRAMRFVTVTALAYVVLVLVNMRYLRYLYPALPLLCMTAFAPFTLANRAIRTVAAVFAAVAVAIGIARIPAAGWMLYAVDLPKAFSARAKQAMLDAEVPPRRLGRIQAAMGDRDSRVAVFGQQAGADIVGRPIYGSWYHLVLGEKVWRVATAVEAARVLVALDITHVIVDRRGVPPVPEAWSEAAATFGKRIAHDPSGDLYEFDGNAVPGVDLLPRAGAPWQEWTVEGRGSARPDGPVLTLAPAAIASAPIDVDALAAGTRVRIAATHACAMPSALRLQLTWLDPQGKGIRVEAKRFECGAAPAMAAAWGHRPKHARTLVAYVVNDGTAPADVRDAGVGAFPL
jgi:hypothetical protein